MNAIDQAEQCGRDDRQRGRPFAPHYIEGRGYRSRRQELDRQEHTVLYQAYLRGWNNAQQQGAPNETTITSNHTNAS